MRRWLVALVIALPLSAQQYQEQITVERILVDTRVVDRKGDPVLGLTTSDFTVHVDGKLAPVESVEWIPETAAQRVIAGIDDDAPATPNAPVTPPKGRLFICFIQTDFARNTPRLAGQMSFNHYAEEMVDQLEEGDRVCVFSFDSHLKFRLDFTDDKRQIKDAIEGSLATDEPPPPPVVANPSVARHLDRAQMKDCKSSEEAFILVANAVRHIDGPKSMILLGWGLGRRSGNYVVMHPKYGIARYALETSRVTVFAIDITEADYHDLEFGLEKAAADTGGMYERAFRFPQMAVDMVEKALEGHYELTVRKPQITTRGTHIIDVAVNRPRVEVYARTTYVDKD